MSKLFSLVCVALAVFVGTCSAAAATYMYTAQYVLRNPDIYPNAHVTGTLYYYYNEGDLLKSRIRYDTSYVFNGNTITSSELYHYHDQAIYTICQACTAATLNANPEKWWYVSNETDACTTVDGYEHCTRRAYAGVSVSDFVYKGTPGSADFDVTYVKFKDGRELTLTGFSGASLTYDKYSGKLEVTSAMKCPEPICKSYVDLVFVLDSSSSVDNNEWTKTQEFVRNAVSHFTIDGDSNAYVGIVDFSAPDKSCTQRDCDERPADNKCSKKNPGKGWWDLCCNNGHVDKISVPLKKKDWWGNTQYEYRYIEDCWFDEKCYPDTDTTAEVLLPLTHEQVMDKIKNIKKMSGHTCQRYGLVEAYKMLFENNPRCTDGVNCPVPIVIVVTDGEDLCHNSTMIWAEKIKQKDDRGLLLEVGVGLEADYDEEFIRNLSSTLPGTDAALSVDDYTQINSILDKLITPVCEVGQVGGSCGPNCGGFCACGVCQCPMCDSEGDDSCHYHECTNAENGCIQKDRVCNNPNFSSQCYNQWCDPDDPTDSCKVEAIDCRAIYEQQLGRPLYPCEIVECIDRVGCSLTTSDSFCQSVSEICKVGKCTPSDPEDSNGCSYTDFVCPETLYNTCETVKCVNEGGKDKCVGEECKTTNCYPLDPESRKHYDLCQPREDCPCCTIECIEEGEYDDPLKRCRYTPMPNSSNMCMINTCNLETQEIEQKRLIGDQDPCRVDDNKCYTYGCDPEGNNGMGACVVTPTRPDFDTTSDLCTVYLCDNKTGWYGIPKCPTTKNCSVARCRAYDGSCYEEDISCGEKVVIPNACMQAVCSEEKGCYRRQYAGAYFDICGNCIRTDPFASSSLTQEDLLNCVSYSEVPLTKGGLAAAAIALIVLGAIVIGAALAVSGVMGTKALIDRARGAGNQSVVSNPLFQESETEMTNPAFIGDTV